MGQPPVPFQADKATTWPRLHTDADLATGASIAGTATHAHYLIHVLRRTTGDPVRLFNGRDGEYAATLAAGRRDSLTFTVAAQLRPQTAEPDIWLALCLLKRDPTELVVQKATELGVSEIHLVLSERTNAAHTNLDRLRSIATEAAEQSERLTIPTLHPPQKLPDLLAAWPAGRTLAAAIERAASPLPHDQHALLVGPEGGFTPRELDALHAAPFIQPVSLGPRILRAETASIAGLALLLVRPPV